MTASHNYAKNEAQGANDYNPYVGDLETIAFNKNYRQDEWDLFSLTVEADLGFAQFVSATSFFDRQYDYSLDGTVYFKYYHAWGCEARSDAAYYYWLWVNPNTGLAVYYPQYCIMPTAVGGNPYQQATTSASSKGPPGTTSSPRNCASRARGRRSTGCSASTTRKAATTGTRCG